MRGESPIVQPHISVSSFSQWAAAEDLQVFVAPTLSSAITWVANLAIYVPFSIPFDFPVQRVWWFNGSTITSTNVDVGVYSPGGARILNAGTTAAAGASAVQYVALGTPVVLTPGQYYLAYVNSNTTSRAGGTTTWTAPMLRAAGCLQQALGSASLPSTLTAAAMANALFPHFGISRAPSGF